MSKNNEMKKKNKQTKKENENCQESIETQPESTGNFFFGGNASLIFLTFGLHFENREGLK